MSAGDFVEIVPRNHVNAVRAADPEVPPVVLKNAGWRAVKQTFPLSEMGDLSGLDVESRQPVVPAAQPEISTAVVEDGLDREIDLLLLRPFGRLACRKLEKALRVAKP